MPANRKFKSARAVSAVANLKALKEENSALKAEIKRLKAATFEEYAGEYIGSAAVDSGQIMVADPCYLETDKFTAMDYERVCRTTDAPAWAGSLVLESVGPDAFVVASATKEGDGHASVYVKRTRPGGRPCRLTVVLP